ncbi:growth-regulating factor 6 [Neltuma alba]|uniref:growth-regulating factor 6 n=1 Tax=Neltuma alba TaxID=207710 RepID=UPI0010A567C1|nr:growth-regulating factor 6-like [Prosopis alba]
MLLHQRNSLLRSNTSPFSDSQMLTFSSPKSEPQLTDKASPNAALPFSYHQLAAYTRNTGYGSGGMHGVLTTRGPFTPSQWMELEHQALIYKYITANMAVPSHLLIPIRKALDSAGFSNFSNGLLRTNTLGWGGFHLGFSNNTDPEPGRCRRTDGKKWRCSRDAVVDQKYCERHMNRGRHRSRKPVEGQSGHAVSGATTTNSASKLIPNASSSASVVVPGNAASNTLSFAHHQSKNLQPLSSHTSAPTNIDRMFMNNKENAIERVQDGSALPMLPPTLDLKPKENPYMIQKEQIPYEKSSRNEFGLVTSDSLLNPSHKSFGSSQNPSYRDAESQQSLRHFMDDWPKLDMQSDRTQLSISIPMASSNFMSSTSSATNEKVTLSPLRLSRELDPIQMDLGVGIGLNESSNRQANWIPIAWESSMGGPLGEVLHLSSNTSDCSKNSSALNLMTDGWENSSSLGSSPTGVLHKTAFGSVSNSNSGSSPQAENNKGLEGASLCNDLLGSTLGNSSSLPTL